MDSSVETMDCHADKSARNDNKKVDSRQAARRQGFKRPQRILGFAMRNVGCKDNRKGVTLAVMTAAIVRRSRIYRAKPNPPTKGAI